MVTQDEINNLTAEEKNFANAGRYIECLRAIRARTLCSLQQSKMAYDNYRGHQPSCGKIINVETIHRPKRTTVVDPQNNDYGCAFCTLEYLTGINRDQIAREIGHDGGDIIDPEKPVPECYATLLETEQNYWLYNNGYAPTTLTSREYLESWTEQRKEKLFSKRFFPDRHDIERLLIDKAAELTVQSARFEGTYHAVAYLAGAILDPRDGCVHELREYKIAGLTLTNIDPYQRLSQILAAQPKEEIVKV